MTRESQRTPQFCQFSEFTLQLLIIIRIAGIQLCIALLFGTVNAHGERLQMTQQRQLDGLLLSNLRHTIGCLSFIAGINQFFPLVTQLISSGPIAPSAYRLLQPSSFLSSGSISLVIHIVVAFHGYLASFRQVTIDGNE